MIPQGGETGTLPTAAAVAAPPQGWRERFLVSREYSSLWFAQVVSAFGDWVGLFAITALASSISGKPEAATALVLTARVAPSFFLGPFMGVLVDRYDRKILMRIADIARALVFMALPFVHSLWGLILASLILELFTLMWSPAKEALVPKLVPREGLTTANSLSVLAAYGTMPLAGALTFALKAGNDALAGVSWLGPLQFDRAIGDTQALVFYFNALTFLFTAFIVWKFVPTSGTPERRARVGSSVAVEPVKALPGETVTRELEETIEEQRFAGFRATLHEIRDGWRFILLNPVVRAVNIGLAAALLGGAILVPLGPAFAKLVIGDVDAFSLYITALGLGVAAGVALLTAVQQRIPKTRVFVAAMFFGGMALLFGISMSTFWLSAIGVFFLGLGAGAVYVLGFTLLQENTDDELRGRTFTTFLTLVRLCVLGAMVLGPTISALLDPLMKRVIDGRDEQGVPVIDAFGVEYALPGVRVTLWLGGVLILVASLLAARSINIGFRENLRALGDGLRNTGVHPRVGAGADAGGPGSDGSGSDGSGSDGSDAA